MTEHRIKLIALINKNLKELLRNAHGEFPLAIRKVIEQWKIGVDEMEELGNVTLESCKTMSIILLFHEHKFKKMSDNGDKEATRHWAAFLSIHQLMALLLPEGMNEGPKNCCPYCPEDC